MQQPITNTYVNYKLQSLYGNVSVSDSLNAFGVWSQISFFVWSCVLSWCLHLTDTSLPKLLFLAYLNGFVLGVSLLGGIELLVFGIQSENRFLSTSDFSLFAFIDRTDTFGLGLRTFFNTEVICKFFTM